MNTAVTATMRSFMQNLSVILAVAVKIMAQGKLYYLNLNSINPKANDRKGKDKVCLCKIMTKKTIRI